MPLITISHSIGSNGEAIARRVADSLQLALYDDSKLQQIALKIGMHADDLKSLDEKAPGLFDRILSEKPQVYLNLMESVIYEVSRHGEGVILGHGSQMLLRSFECAFHVRVHAAEATRMQRIVNQQNLSPKAAAKLIRKIDDRQRGFLRYAFGLDWNNPSLYDLIVNSEKLNIDTAAKLVVDGARSEDIATCSLNALDTMEKLSKAKQVHAALIKHNVDVTNLHVEVTEKGTALITGLASAAEDIERMKDVAKDVPGISEVALEVTFFAGGYV
jgi:cytidylate kinase